MHVQLAVDMPEVGLDGAYTNDQGLSHLRVRLTGGDQAQDIQFALAQRLYQIGRWHASALRKRFPLKRVLRLAESLQQSCAISRSDASGGSQLEQYRHRLPLVNEESNIAVG